MNINQRIVLFATAAVLIVLLLFPPFKSLLGEEGYSCILIPHICVHQERRPPKQVGNLIPLEGENIEVGNTPRVEHVNLGLFALQFLIVTTVGGILCLALKPK